MRSSIAVLLRTLRKLICKGTCMTSHLPQRRMLLIRETLAKRSIPQQRSQAAFAEQAIPGFARADEFGLRSCENSLFHGSVYNIPLFRISAAERTAFEL